jgi:pilus assembly protein Flp/PilA
MLVQWFGSTALTFEQPCGVTFSQWLPTNFTPSCEVDLAGGVKSPWNQGAKTMSKFLKLIRNEEGATAIEYGLIAALIAVAAIGAMQGIGNKLNTTFNNVSTTLGSAAT